MPDSEKIYSELNDSQNAEPTNFEDYWIGLVGNTLYDKFINKYSKKMWEVKNNKEIDEVTFSFKNKKEDNLKKGSKMFRRQEKCLLPSTQRRLQSIF